MEYQKVSNERFRSLCFVIGLIINPRRETDEEIIFQDFFLNADMLHTCSGNRTAQRAYQHSHSSSSADYLSGAA